MPNEKQLNKQQDIKLQEIKRTVEELENKEWGNKTHLHMPKYSESVSDYSFAANVVVPVEIEERHTISKRNNLYVYNQKEMEYYQGYELASRNQIEQLVRTSDYINYNDYWFGFYKKTSYKKNRKKLVKRINERKKKEMRTFQEPAMQTVKPMAEFLNGEERPDVNAVINKYTELKAQEPVQFELDKLYEPVKKEQDAQQTTAALTEQKVNFQTMTDFYKKVSVLNPDELFGENVVNLIREFRTMVPEKQDLSITARYLSKAKEKVIAREPKAAYMLLMASVTANLARKIDAAAVSHSDLIKMNLTQFGNIWAQADLAQTAAQAVVLSKEFQENTARHEREIYEAREAAMQKRIAYIQENYAGTLGTMWNVVFYRLGINATDPELMDDATFQNKLAHLNLVYEKHMNLLDQHVKSARVQDITLGSEFLENRYKQMLLDNMGEEFFNEEAWADYIGLKEREIEFKKERADQEKVKLFDSELEKQALRLFKDDKILDGVKKDFVFSTAHKRMNMVSDKFVTAPPEVVSSLRKNEYFMKALVTADEEAFLKLVLEMDNNYKDNILYIENKLLKKNYFTYNVSKQAVINSLGAGLYYMKPNAVREEAKRIIEDIIVENPRYAKHEEELVKNFRKLNIPEDKWKTIGEMMIFEETHAKEDDDLLFTGEYSEQQITESYIVRASELIDKRKGKLLEAFKEIELSRTEIAALYKEFNSMIITSRVTPSEKDVDFDVRLSVLKDQYLSVRAKASSAVYKNLSGQKLYTLHELEDLLAAEQKELNDYLDAYGVEEEVADLSSSYVMQLVKNLSSQYGGVRDSMSNITSALNEVLEKGLLEESLPYLKNVKSIKELDKLNSMEFENFESILVQRAASAKPFIRKYRGEDAFAKSLNNIMVSMLCGEINEISGDDVVLNMIKQEVTMEESMRKRFHVMMNKDAQEPGAIQYDYMKLNKGSENYYPEERRQRFTEAKAFWDDIREYDAIAGTDVEGEIRQALISFVGGMTEKFVPVEHNGTIYYNEIIPATGMEEPQVKKTWKAEDLVKNVYLKQLSTFALNLGGYKLGMFGGLNEEFEASKLRAMEKKGQQALAKKADLDGKIKVLREKYNNYKKAGDKENTINSGVLLKKLMDDQEALEKEIKSLRDQFDEEEHNEIAREVKEDRISAARFVNYTSRKKIYNFFKGYKDNAPELVKSFSENILEFMLCGTEDILLSEGGEKESIFLEANEDLYNKQLFKLGENVLIKEKAVHGMVDAVFDERKISKESSLKERRETYLKLRPLIYQMRNESTDAEIIANNAFAKLNRIVEFMDRAYEVMIDPISANRILTQISTFKQADRAQELSRLFTNSVYEFRDTLTKLKKDYQALKLDTSGALNACYKFDADLEELRAILKKNSDVVSLNSELNDILTIMNALTRDGDLNSTQFRNEVVNEESTKILEVSVLNMKRKAANEERCGYGSIYELHDHLRDYYKLYDHRRDNVLDYKLEEQEEQEEFANHDALASYDFCLDEIRANKLERLLPYMESSKYFWNSVMNDLTFNKYAKQLSGQLKPLLDVMEAQSEGINAAMMDFFIRSRRADIMMFIDKVFSTPESLIDKEGTFSPVDYDTQHKKWKEEFEIYRNDFLNKEVNVEGGKKTTINKTIEKAINKHPEAISVLEVLIGYNKESMETLYTPDMLETAIDKYVKLTETNKKAADDYFAGNKGLMADEDQAAFIKAHMKDIQSQLFRDYVLTDAKVFAAKMDTIIADAVKHVKVNDAKIKEGIKRSKRRDEESEEKRIAGNITAIESRKRTGRELEAAQNKTFTNLKQRMYQGISPLTSTLKVKYPESVKAYVEETVRKVPTVAESLHLPSEEFTQMVVEAILSNAALKTRLEDRKAFEEWVNKKVLKAVAVYQNIEEALEGKKLTMSLADRKYETNRRFMYAVAQGAINAVGNLDEIEKVQAVNDSTYAAGQKMLKEFKALSDRTEDSELSALIKEEYELYQYRMFTAGVTAEDFRKELDQRIKYYQKCISLYQRAEEVCNKEHAGISVEKRRAMQQAVREFMKIELLDYSKDDYLFPDYLFMDHKLFDILVYGNVQDQVTEDTLKKNKEKYAGPGKADFMTFLAKKADKNSRKAYNSMTDKEKMVFALALTLPATYKDAEVKDSVSFIWENGAAATKTMKDDIKSIITLIRTGNETSVDYESARMRLTDSEKAFNKDMFNDAYAFTKECMAQFHEMETKNWTVFNDPYKVIERRKNLGLATEEQKAMPQNLTNITEFRSSLADLLKNHTDLQKSVTELTDSQTGLLVTILQNRTILDASTAKHVDKKKAAVLNPMMRKQVMQQLCTDGGAVIESDYNKPIYLNKAMAVIFSYQLDDTKPYLDGMFDPQKDIVDAKRKDAIDIKLLKKALDMLKERNKLVSDMAVRHTTFDVEWHAIEEVGAGDAAAGTEATAYLKLQKEWQKEIDSTMKFNIFEQPESRSQEKRFEKHSDEFKHAARTAWEANWKQSLDDMLKAKDYGGEAMMNKNLSAVGADSMDERGFRVKKKEERQESFDAWREAELNRLKEDEDRPVNN